MSNPLVILSRQEPKDGLAPLGRRDEVLGALFDHNTGPECEGGDVLYGPGIQVELTPGEDPIRQMLLTVTEEEIGWLVITRLAKLFEWKIVDTGNGQELNP